MYAISVVAKQSTPPLAQGTGACGKRMDCERMQSGVGRAKVMVAGQSWLPLAQGTGAGQLRMEA